MPFVSQALLALRRPSRRRDAPRRINSDFFGSIGNSNRREASFPDFRAPGAIADRCGGRATRSHLTSGLWLHRRGGSEPDPPRGVMSPTVLERRRAAWPFVNTAAATRTHDSQGRQPTWSSLEWMTTGAPDRNQRAGSPSSRALQGDPRNTLSRQCVNTLNQAAIRSIKFRRHI